jgi:dihydroorotase
LVLIDLERPHRIDVGNFRSKSKNSPFDGRPVEGLAVATVLGGRILHALDSAPAGLRQPLA